MNCLQKIAIGCGTLALGTIVLLGWAMGAAPWRSPRNLTERMIGVPLPHGITPEVNFSGLLGPIPTDIEYIAHVNFVMPADNLEAFVNTLGCPVPSAENQYECTLDFPQGPSGTPPKNGTAESRLFQFRFQENGTVRVQMRLLAT